LLDLENWNQTVGHPVAGPSWEGLVVENLIAAAGQTRTPSYYRTEDGAEIDLLFERGGKVEMAIEIKRSTAPVMSRGFHIACEVLKSLDQPSYSLKPSITDSQSRQNEKIESS
jgi:hypothetical protein